MFKRQRTEDELRKFLRNISFKRTILLTAFTEKTVQVGVKVNTFMCLFLILLLYGR